MSAHAADFETKLETSRGGGGGGSLATMNPPPPPHPSLCTRLQELIYAKPKSIFRVFPFCFFFHENSQRGYIRVRKLGILKTDSRSTMGVSIARKRTPLRHRVLRHQLAQVYASSCIMTCFSWAAMVFPYSKHACTIFLTKTCLRKSCRLLENPQCQTQMCSVAYSCSYVLLLNPIQTGGGGGGGTLGTFPEISQIWIEL